MEDQGREEDLLAAKIELLLQIQYMKSQVSFPEHGILRIHIHIFVVIIHAINLL